MLPDYNNRFLCKIDIKSENECWNWTASKCSDGYGHFRFEGSIVGSHIVMYKLYNNIKDLQGLHILHSCDNPACCNPKHLRAGTASENAIDKVNKNRHNNHKGELHPSVTLTEEIVLLIRKLYKEGKSQAELGRKFEVTRANIHYIVHNKSWSHI